MSALGVPDRELRWLWALFNNGDIDTVKAMCPPDFNWLSLHPDDGITALQSLIDPLIVNEEKRQGVLDLAVWMMQQGADPTLKSSEECNYTGYWYKSNKDKRKEEKTQVEANYSGESTITTIIAVRDAMAYSMDKLGTVDADWTDDIAWLEKLLALLTKESPAKRRRDMTLVDSSVVDMWDNMRHDRATHDMVLLTSDGPISAHAAILSRCSPVLAAMLSSPMAEGQKRSIGVTDAPEDAVHLLLELMYTGTTCAEFGHEPALAALDMAHRWQVHGVTTMLEHALQSMLSDDNFGSVAEAAKLKGLQALMGACRAFGSRSKHVKKELKARRFPGPVLELMGATSPTRRDRPAKVRRTW